MFLAGLCCRVALKTIETLFGFVAPNCRNFLVSDLIYRENLEEFLFVFLNLGLNWFTITRTYYNINRFSENIDYLKHISSYLGFCYFTVNNSQHLPIGIVG